MAKKRQGAAEEWRSFGVGVYELRNGLLELGTKYSSLLPKKLMVHYFKTLREIDKFRSDAEDEMFRRGGPQDKKIWYPGNTEE